MKFVFISDIHLSGYTNDKTIVDTNLTERLNYIKNTLDNIIIYCKENKIDKIIIGGDCLHNKSIIHTIAQALLINFIRSNSDINFIIIDGNHDLSGKGENVVSALLSLDNEPNVQRIGTESLFYHDKENDILYVPYSSEMIKIIKLNKAKYLVSHFGLNEGMLNSGMSVVGEIKLSDLIGKYQICLLGHYHLPQSIIKDNIQVYYSGSIVHLTWNDKNEEKRFLLVDTDNNSIISIPTTGYRKHIELIITNENKNEIIEQARKIKLEGHLVNIRKDIEVDTKNIEEEFIIVDRTEKDINNRGLSTSMTETQIFNKFLEIKKISKEELPLYQNIAMNIIENCKELI